MKIHNVLTGIGLSEKEAKAYLVLLELKEALPSTVARKSGLKRPTAYVILEQLQKQGLASHTKRGRLTYYQAANPHWLLERQHKRYSDLEHALPELLQLHQMYASTPQMTIFEGKEGLMRIMEDTLSSSTELLVWADVSLVVGSVLNEYYPTYIKKKVERKLWVRGVVSDDPIAKAFQARGKAELRELYLIPKKEFPFRNEINIYDDKVAIISHEDNVGVILQNANIATTQRSIHKLTFEYAKLLNKTKK